MTYYIGLDIGTSSCRAVAFDREFNLLASASGSYALSIPRAGWAEQDPDEILDSVVQVINEVMAHPKLQGKKPKAIGISAVMHSLILLSSEGNPLTKAIIWADLRSRDQAQQLVQRAQTDDLYGRTGCPVHPTYLPAKLLWLKENQPELMAKTAKILSIKGYVVYKLTGQILEEFSTASTTGLFNLETMDWDDGAVAAAGISRDLLPQLADPMTVLPGFGGQYAESRSLPMDIPVVLGATDGTLSNLGSGAVRPGQMVAMVGTSGAVRAVMDSPKLDPKQRCWCYYLAQGKWVSGGALNNGGNITNWFRHNFGQGAQREAEKRGLGIYELLDQWASSVPAGSRGLVFLPMLFGERSPGWNPDSRGVLFGLNSGHGAPEVYRAMMEGVTFHLFGVYEALVELLGRPQQILASGGFAHSPVWVQMMADVFGVSVQLPKVLEGSAFGAAFLAAVALGEVSNLDAVTELVVVEAEVEPDGTATKRYRELYRLYRSLYEKLTPEFAEIAKFQEG